MRHLRSSTFAGTVTALALLGSAGGAAASPPTHEPFQVSGQIFDDTSCVDPIRVDYQANEVMHTYYDASGNATRLKFTGKASNVYTDLLTGKTYAPHSSGPGTFDLATGTGVVRGGNSAFDTQGRLIAVSGRIVYDAVGNIVSLVGHVSDICVKLGTTSTAR